jgi:hypothetical protein
LELENEEEKLGHQELKRRSWPSGTEEEKLGRQELKMRSLLSGTEKEKPGLII